MTVTVELFSPPVSRGMFTIPDTCPNPECKEDLTQAGAIRDLSVDETIWSTTYIKSKKYDDSLLPRYLERADESFSLDFYCAECGESLVTPEDVPVEEDADASTVGR